MVVPLLGLLLLASLQTIGVVSDAALAQEAARRGVRVAVVTTDDGAVSDMIGRIVGPRPTQVTITPARRPGSTVTVQVTITSRLGPLRPQVAGSATARGEPVLSS